MCPCDETHTCGSHLRDISERLDRVDNARHHKNGIVADREMSFLRIDYGAERIERVVAERAAPR